MDETIYDDIDSSLTNLSVQNEQTQTDNPSHMVTLSINGHYPINHCGFEKEVEIT